MKQTTLIRQLRAAAALRQPFSAEDFAIATYGRAGRAVGASAQILRRLTDELCVIESSTGLFELTSAGKSRLHEALVPARSASTPPVSESVAAVPAAWVWFDPFIGVHWWGDRFGNTFWFDPRAGWCAAPAPPYSVGQWRPAA